MIPDMNQTACNSLTGQCWKQIVGFSFFFQNDVMMCAFTADEEQQSSCTAPECPLSGSSIKE